MTGRARRVILSGLLCAGAVLLSGCGAMSSMSYYAQSISGHLALLRAARPIDTVLADPATAPALRARLEQVRVMRAFASRELGLPDNASYRSYAELDRPYAVWNVVAAPELSLKPKEWCFPVVGCVGYRGYYRKADADAEAEQLRQSGWDAQVGGVPAYSTLGWTADPVLSTFINAPEGEVARLLFHELAHQLIYVQGDSYFNESFAVSVEQEGVRRWLRQRGDAALDTSFRQYAARRKAFVALLTHARGVLAALYAQPAGADPSMMRAGKQAAFAALQADYAAAKASPANALYGYAGYDRYFAQQLNNAHLAAVATYTQKLPAFEHLLDDNGGDLPRYYEAVRRLAALDRVARDARLMALGGG